MLESQNVQRITLDTPVRWRAHQLMQTTTNWGTSRVKLNKPEVQSHDHLREVELYVKELNHRKYSSFHFLLFSMHLCPKTSSKPIFLGKRYFFVCYYDHAKQSWWTCVSFPSLSGQTKTRRVSVWLGLQASEVVITGKGVGVARQVARSGVGRGAKMSNKKKSNITFNLLESRFNWKLWKSIFPDSETFWLMGWIMN